MNPANHDPLVTIIILNWNGLQDTLACLGSLASIEYSHYQVVVVDNGSHDGSIAAIRQAFPTVVLLENEQNLGFVGGNNQGIDYALEQGADYVLLLNNDTEVAPDFLRRLVEVAELDPSIGMVGPTVYFYAEPDRIWSAGGRIDWNWGNTSMIGLNDLDQGQYGVTPRPVDFITGCALFVRTDLVRQIGALDPRFFAYFEETEWCVRAARAGYQIRHIPKARVWHKISVDAREASPQVHYYMIRNRLLFLKLTQAGWKPWFNTIFREFVPRLVSWTVKPKWRYKAPQRGAMIRAMIDFSLGRFGKVDTAKPS
jgi:GT2 family glycosyltransferase